MPDIDFYVLSKGGEQSLLLQACRIIEQAWRAGRRIHVQFDSEARARRFDDLLWTFRQGSFVPHEPPGATPDAHGHAVSVGFGATLPGHYELVVNLSEKIPGGFAQCQRIAELVSPDDEYRQRARERYRHYREAGCTLHNHEVEQ